MAHGYPDWMDWEGRSGIGLNTVNYSFSFVVVAGATQGINIPAPAAGTKQVFQFLNVSCLENASIHRVSLQRAVDGWVFYYSNFIMDHLVNFPGQEIHSTTNTQLFVTNNAAVNLTFIGTIGYTNRPSV